MGIVNTEEWLRTAADNTEARASKALQHAYDLRTLAGALGCFLEHPNTPDTNREELNHALNRLLGGDP